VLNVFSTNNEIIVLNVTVGCTACGLAHKPMLILKFDANTNKSM
jgi:hypothetical protein